MQRLQPRHQLVDVSERQPFEGTEPKVAELLCKCVGVRHARSALIWRSITHPSKKACGNRLRSLTNLSAAGSPVNANGVAGASSMRRPLETSRLEMLVCTTVFEGGSA